MRTIRALLFLGGVAAAAAVFAQEPASAYGHGHGAFASPSSRTRARSYARRAYYRAPTTYSTYRAAPAPTYSSNGYDATTRYVQRAQVPSPVAAASAPAPAPVAHRYVDSNGNVWIERTHSAPVRTARYVQPTYVSARPPAAVESRPEPSASNSRIEYDESGRPWIRRDATYRTRSSMSGTSSPAPAAGAGLGSAVRSLRAARDSSPESRAVRVDYPAPRPVPGTYSSTASTCFT